MIEGKVGSAQLAEVQNTFNNSKREWRIG